MLTYCTRTRTLVQELRDRDRDHPPLDQFSSVLTQLLTWKPTINYITNFNKLNLSNFNTNFNTNDRTFITDVTEQTIES